MVSLKPRNLHGIASLLSPVMAFYLPLALCSIFFFCCNTYSNEGTPGKPECELEQVLLK